MNETNESIDDIDWTADFKPVPIRGAHRWRIEGGPTASSGTRASCVACGLRVEARVAALGVTLAPVLYHADKSGLPYVATRDRCPAEPCTR